MRQTASRSRRMNKFEQKPQAVQQQQQHFVNVSYPNVTMTQGSVKMVVTSSAPQSGQEMQQQQPQHQMVTTSYPQPQFFQTTPVTTTIQRGQQNATATTVHFDPISLQQLTAAGWAPTQLPAEVSSLFLQPTASVAQVVTNTGQQFQQGQAQPVQMLVQSNPSNQQQGQTMLVMNAQTGQAILQTATSQIGQPTQMQPVGKKAAVRRGLKQPTTGIPLQQRGNTLVVSGHVRDMKPRPRVRIRKPGQGSVQQGMMQQQTSQAQIVIHSSTDSVNADSVESIVDAVAHGYMGEVHNQVQPSTVQSTTLLPTTGRPRGRSNDEWRLVGVFDTEQEMQRARLEQRVSKRKVNHMKTGYKVTYRCNSWRRLGCHYSMYAIHNKEDGRISLHERGQHIHPLVPAPRKSIVASAAAVCHFGSVTGVGPSAHGVNMGSDEIDIMGIDEQQTQLHHESKPKRRRPTKAQMRQQQAQQASQQPEIKAQVVDMKPQQAFIINDLPPQQQQVQFQLQVQPNGQSAIVQVHPNQQQHIQLLQPHGQPVVQHVTGGTQVLLSSPQNNQNLQAILQCMQQQNQPAQIVVSSQQH